MTIAAPGLTVHDVRGLWVTDLMKSDKPEDFGRGYLARPTPSGIVRCVKGVLADLAVKAGIIPEPYLMKDEFGVEFFLYDGRPSMLSKKILAWAGLPMIMWVPLSTEENIALFGSATAYGSAVTTINDHGRIIETHRDMVPYVTRSLAAVA